MKINKLILKIQHFFGCNRDNHHIDDVMVNLECDDWSDGKRSRILFGDNKSNQIEKEDILEIKSKVCDIFMNNPDLEKRCKTVSQVYITFYKSNDIKYGGLVKILYYKNGILYYPYDKDDRISFEREQKIEKLLQ